MNLDAGRGILTSALKTVQARWEDVAPHWQDARRQEFVEKVWEPLQMMTTGTLEAVEQMQTLLGRMKRECEGTTSDLLGGV